MTTLHVSHTALVSGGERSLLEHLAVEHAAGRQAIVATPEGDFAERVRLLGIRVEPIPPFEAPFGGGLRSLPIAAAAIIRTHVALRRVVRRTKPSSLRANSVRAGLVCIGLGRGVAVDVVVHDALPTNTIGGAIRALLRRCTRTLIFNSQYTANVFGPSAPASASVVAPILDVDRFLKVERTDDPLRPPTVGIVGQISPWKGHDDAIRMLALLREELPTARLRIIGSVVFSGPRRTFDNDAFVAGLDTLAAQLGVADAIDRTGSSEDVASLLAELDAVVVPSWAEPFGRVVVEAMAAGVPVVATNVGGPAEIIDHEVSGFLAPPKQPSAWIGPLRRALSPEGAAIGRAARVRAAEIVDEARHLTEALDSPTGRGSALRVLAIGAEHHDARPGGLNRYFDALARASEAADVDVTRVEIGSSTLAASLPKRILAVRRQVRRATITGPFDVVDAHFALYAALPLATTRIRRIPLVVHFQGPWAAEARSLGHSAMRTTIMRAIERFVYRRADKVIVLSAAFGRLLAKDYGVAPENIEVIAPGVDLDRFSPPVARQAEPARRQLGLRELGPVVAVVRRLDPRMGIDVLLDAWNRVLVRFPDATLAVAGDGPERERLTSQADQTLVPGSIRFLGRVDDDRLVDLYRVCDLTVVPSTALEGFGLVVLESLACGVPPVVTDVAGLPDGVRGLDPSLIVRPNADELAERIISALSGNRPSALSCRRHAEAFSWAHVARRHREIYEALSRPTSRA